MSDPESLKAAAELAKAVSKPTVELIKAFRAATGILYEPVRVKRLAKAKAESRLIEVETDLAIIDLSERVSRSEKNQWELYQRNLEHVIDAAVPELETDSTPACVDPDWYTYFSQAAKLVSNEEMQIVWGKVLAGEVNSPGTFSKRTLSIVSTLSADEANSFTNLCASVWVIETGAKDEIVPIVYIDNENELMLGTRLNLQQLLHLETIGLISVNTNSPFTRQFRSTRFKLRYFRSAVELEVRGIDAGRVSLGNVILSEAGKELYPIAGVVQDQDLYLEMCSLWSDMYSSVFI